MSDSIKKYDIDKEGDALHILLRIYTQEKYDVLNARNIITKAIIELVLKNISDKHIEINNPKLVVVEDVNFNQSISKYNSKEIENIFPISIGPGYSIPIPYSSANLNNILKQNVSEKMFFQIESTTGEVYTSVLLDGDSLESLISDMNKMRNWDAIKIYEFDNKIE